MKRRNHFAVFEPNKRDFFVEQISDETACNYFKMEIDMAVELYGGLLQKEI